MAYNKARAEKKWLKWKEAEEKKLRELGVDEETIQRLHTYDWAEFNRERRYLQRQVEWSPYVDMISAQDLELPVEDVESFMDSIAAYPLQGGQAHHPNRLFEDVRLQRV